MHQPHCLRGRGRYALSTGQEHPLTATLSGSTWSYTEIALPGGAAYAYLSGVSCTSTTSCEAAGRYAATTPSNGEQYTHALVETLSGATWTAVIGLGPTGNGSSWLAGISCTSSSACTAIGDWYPYTPIGQVPLVVTLSDGSWSHAVLSGVDAQAALPSNYQLYVRLR